jgi:uncharacterized delta-60 repeat protein
MFNLIGRVPRKLPRTATSSFRNSRLTHFHNFLSAAAIVFLLSFALLCPAVVRPAKAKVHVTPQQVAGSLDTSFGTAGTVTTAFAGPSLAQAVAQQSDGRLVVVGHSVTTIGTLAFTGSVISRYNTDGSLDTTFGTNGQVSIPTPDFLALAIAIQPVDGRIVLGGSSLEALTGASDYKLVRLNTDGSVDMTFGTAGLVDTSFSGANVSVVFSLAIQSDGAIVAAGTSATSGSATIAAFSAARYTSAGVLDTTFNTNGQVVISLPTSIATSVAIQADGKILLGGETGSGLTGFNSIVALLIGTKIAVVRLNSDGTLDTAFGTGGSVQTAIGTGAVASQVLVQSDQNIVAAGTTLSTLGVVEVALTRYTTTGAPDTTFGTGGVVTTNFDSEFDIAAGIALQSDGKILATGVDFTSPRPADQTEPASRVSPQGFGFIFSEVVGIQGSKIALLRYNTDGSLDTSFGSNGVVTTSIGESAVATSVIVQSDGNIVVAGASSPDMSTVDFAVARYESGPAGGDFALSPTQTSQIVELGSSVTLTIDVSAVSDSNPPSSPIALSASVAPSTGGVTATLIPASIDAGASSSLVVAAVANATPGNYTVTVTGTAGSTTHTTTAAVTVVSGPDFDLGFTSSSIPAPRGTKITVNVDINRAGGFAGKVKVSAPHGPAGVVLKTASPEGTKGNIVSFTYKIKPIAATGAVQLTFSGISPSTGNTRTATVTLVVQ